jgi:beta-galactoside alpha-2,3-sialyltransferase (sialyltransferase 4A)
MFQDMRIKVLRHSVLSTAALSVLLLFVPRPAAGEESVSEDLQEVNNLQTSVRGPLQQKLAAAYPDSFREGVDIFWEPRDGWVSSGIIDWWISRLTREDDGGVTQEAAQRMFSRFPEQGPVFSSSRKRRICAVVGPSRNLLESGYGDLIDAHDVVIRINRAPTNDFDSDVGKKTTHHVMWPRPLDEDQFDRRAFLLMIPVATNTVSIFDRIVELAVHFEWDPERVRIIHPEFVKYLHENWTKERRHYPSTGFIALMMALHLCDEVDVFGFGADASGRWDRYYEDDPVDASGFHPVDYEGQLRRDMEEKGILKVFRGNRLEPGSQTGLTAQD